MSKEFELPRYGGDCHHHHHHCEPVVLEPEDAPMYKDWRKLMEQAENVKEIAEKLKGQMPKRMYQKVRATEGGETNVWTVELWNGEEYDLYVRNGNNYGPVGPRGPKGFQGDQGPKGDTFTYEDMTNAQKDELASHLDQSVLKQIAARSKDFAESASEYLQTVQEQIAELAESDDVDAALKAKVAENKAAIGSLESGMYGFNPLQNLHNGWIKTNSFEDITAAKNYVIIPINGGDKITIVSNDTRTAAVICLKSYSEPTVGTPADFASGWSAKMPAGAEYGPGSTYKFVAPSDAKYLYVQRIYNNTVNFYPARIEINGLDVENDLKHNIEALNYYLEIANSKILKNADDISKQNANIVDFKDQSKPVLGSRENVEYNLRQGIITDDGNINASRPDCVSTTNKISAKKWKIELKDGFVLTRIVVWDGNTANKWGSSRLEIYNQSYTYDAENETQIAICRTNGQNVTPADEPIKSFRYILVEGAEEKLAKMEDKIESIGKPTSITIPRMYPDVKLPVISLEFDDCPPQDAVIVDLLDKYNAKCSFAFMATEDNIKNDAPRYLSWQKRGYGVCSHSIDAESVINTTDALTDTTSKGLSEEEALMKFIVSKERLEEAGIAVNGWVSPNSRMSVEFIPLLRKVYAYGFTRGTDANNVRTNENHCLIVRKSMQATSTQALKDYIDSCIAEDKIITLYGHASQLGLSYKVDGTDMEEIWSLEKIETIVKYIIEKRNAGLVYFGNTDDCVKYYFGL